MKKLSDLNLGERATVTEITSTTDMNRRFLDIGLIKGTKVECVLAAPTGEPKAFLIRSTVIALRNDDISGIAVEMLKGCDSYGAYSSEHGN